jgi:hypothetical protein
MTAANAVVGLVAKFKM